MRGLRFDLENEPAGLTDTLRQPAGRVFLREGRESFSIGDVRKLANGVAQLLSTERRDRGDEDFPPVGIFVRSAFHFAAAVLGAWKAGFQPILIDPSSRQEIDRLVERFPGIRLLAGRDLVPPRHGLVLPDPLDDVPIVAPGLRDPCVCFFTSGSEGVPKLVPKSGRQVYAHVGAASCMLEVPRSCRAVCFVPLFHILGFSYGFMAPLRAGGETVVLVGQPPAAMRDALLSLRPDLVVAAAVHYRFLNSVLAPGDRLPEATYISSGAPLSPTDRARFEDLTGQRITELYGSTETAGIAWRRGDDPWTPYPGVEVDIGVDRLRVRSPWAHPESPDRWVSTHDVAEADGEGFRLLGRSGNIVKIGGKRFSSVEVEHLLRDHPGVTEAAAVPYERYGEPALAAFVVPASRPPPSIGDLRSHLARHLAPFKVPRKIQILEALPRKKLEKLDYAALQALANRREEAPHSSTQ